MNEVGGWGGGGGGGGWGRVWKEPTLSLLAECGKTPTLPFGRVWKETNLSLLAESGKSLISHF